MLASPDFENFFAFWLDRFSRLEWLPGLYHEGFVPGKNFLVGEQPVFSVISLGFPWRDGPVREGLLRA
jgi:hypothetical protein